MHLLVLVALLYTASLAGQEVHDHPIPEKLGRVSFLTSCTSATQNEFNRAVALLHSFAYSAAEEAFRSVATQDPHCAMAHWGMAMTHFHQLWEPAVPTAGISAAEKEIRAAEVLGGTSERERGYIHALSMIFEHASSVPYSTLAANYEKAMREVAAANPKDVEAQVFYALALLANASPFDKDHRKQEEAADLLEPLYRQFSDHPGIPHYLIHACDSQEMAARGLGAARAYSKIAPSAPHALHMPSHIFTRLGLWEDSIASNLAAESAAHRDGDVGEELHAMDYLVYAYLQSGRDQEAETVIQKLKAMPRGDKSDFKVGYAATAMPVRYIIEQQQWSDAEKILEAQGPALPQVVAMTVWARGLGFARNGHLQEADRETERLGALAEQLRVSGNSYWAAQVDVSRREVKAWAAQAANKPEEATSILRSAADDEDKMEKLPVTPGPIVPAREQLGQLLLFQGNSVAAAVAFQATLANAPGRRGALQGAARAAQGVPKR